MSRKHFLSTSSLVLWTGFCEGIIITDGVIGAGVIDLGVDIRLMY